LTEKFSRAAPSEVHFAMQSCWSSEIQSISISPKAFIDLLVCLIRCRMISKN
jgi:hypothetical protein